jgi:hypothetical protein
MAGAPVNRALEHARKASLTGFVGGEAIPSK